MRRAIVAVVGTSVAWAILLIFLCGSPETRLEREVEASVRAEAPERCPRDDQPASLIGMIR